MNRLSVGTFFLVLLAVSASKAVAEDETGDDAEFIVLEILPRDKRHVSDKSLQAAPEYLELLHELNGQGQERQADVARRSPQEESYSTSDQLYQHAGAYNLHQVRLRAALAGQKPVVQTFGGTDENLQRQAALNAQEAAKNFRSSYQQNVQVRQPSQIRQLQPTYAPEAEAQQYHVETTQQPAAQNFYNSYTPNTRLDAGSQASLQAYQQQANAALAFQQAIQQSPRTGARPRLSQPQYILQQQHSYVVADPTVAPEVSTDVPVEQYNIAALQQAYQQIESANQKAVEHIQRQPARQRQRYQQAPQAQTHQQAPQAQTYQQAPQAQTYQEDDVASIGAGDGFEFVKAGRQQQKLTPTVQPLRFEPETVYETVTPTVKPVTRTRQRVQQPAVQTRTQYEAQIVTTPAPLEYRRPVAVEQPQYTRVEQPAVQQYTAPVQQPKYARVEQPAVQQYTAPVQQPQYTRAEQPALQQYTAPVEQPQYSPRVEQPKVQQYTRPQYRVVEQPATEQTRTTALQYTRPTEQPKSVAVPQYTIPATAAPSVVSAAAPSTTPAKVGNIDINLLRSLYTAAEALAKKQKEEVGPVTEDDFVQALLAQGRREQQAAEIIQSAAKSAPPAPTDKEIDIVHIPKTKNQRPITLDELDALIKAGYDVRPIGSPKVLAPVADPSDPIRQQYLRQATFLERQAALKNIRQRAVHSDSDE